ncbi:BCL2 associated agonist of cell death b [Genypterus blacodes]|uniref:BCL2 associated agonist of cell death b n=1 Tax=Genypterus blacodes TaxID=154954 RepID=UPI003F7599BE
MATHFTISSSDSETSEVEEPETSEVEEPETSQDQRVPQRHNLTLPDLRPPGSGRMRLNSESHASTACRDDDLQFPDEDGTPTDGAPFRGRSKSAPPALWAAKKYGQKLRRMSDEFDTLLDRGEMRKVRSAGSGKQMAHSKSWWNYLFSHQETEGENNHHENHTQRTE